MRRVGGGRVKGGERETETERTRERKRRFSNSCGEIPADVMQSVTDTSGKQRGGGGGVGEGWR